MPTITKTRQYSEPYKDELFLIWYNAGKPSVNHFVKRYMIPDKDGQIPNVATIGKWAREEWEERAQEYDDGVRKAIQDGAVATKVLMLKRHAEIGEKMQTVALEYLETHKDEMTSQTAVRMLIEGVRIERESRGLPEALSGLSDVSDEKILRQLEELVTRSPLSIEPANNDADVIDLGNGYGVRDEET